MNIPLPLGDLPPCLPACETATLPARMAQLFQLAEHARHSQRASEARLLEALEREEAKVVDSLERLDQLVDRQGSSPDERRARSALLDYLGIILSFGSTPEKAKTSSTF